MTPSFYFRYSCRLLIFSSILLLLSGCWWRSNDNDGTPQDTATRADSTAAAPDKPASDIVFEEPAPPSHQETAHVDSQPDHAAVNTKNRPRVAIIIDDMGYHKNIGLALLELDLDLSFAFLPHAPFAMKLEETAYQKGRDIMVHLPMEAGNAKWDPGPGALYLAALPEEQRTILKKDLASVPHAIGANNHMGSKFTQDRPAMHRVLAELKAQKLFFIDSFTTAKSTGLDEAQKMGIPTNRRHIFLDNVQDPDKICLQLDKLAIRAGKQRQAIAIGHPYQATLDALRKCGKKLQQNVDIVPVHTLVK